MAGLFAASKPKAEKIHRAPEGEQRSLPWGFGRGGGRFKRRRRAFGAGGASERFGEVAGSGERPPVGKGGASHKGAFVKRVGRLGLSEGAGSEAGKGMGFSKKRAARAVMIKDKNERGRKP